MATAFRSKVPEYILTAFLALIAALNYHMFVFANAFAPAGLNGIATMIQHVFHFSMGYMALIVNVPLAVFAYFKLSRDYACKTMLFSIVFSLALLIFQQKSAFGFLVYHTADGVSRVLAPVASGAIYGIVYGFVFRTNGSTGGTDVIAAYVHKVRPEYNTMWIIFALNCTVACLSYFVYGFNIEPVILCVLYCFMSSHVGDSMLRGWKQALKFEIITDQPDTLSRCLLHSLGHGVTLLPATGMYSQASRSLLICVVNRHQVADFIDIIENFPGSFAYVSPVAETVGNFKTIPARHGQPNAFMPLDADAPS